MSARVVCATFAAVLLSAAAVADQERKPTADVGAGPNFRAGAPYRAKLSPPWAEGETLLVRGTIVDTASGEGISGVVLNAYHADHRGNYDTEGYNYRGRILTDENGRYEFETIVPSNYGPPPHIHFIITHPDYATLPTEMRFLDEHHPTNKRPELTPELQTKRKSGRSWKEGTFDVALQAKDGD